MGKRPRPRAWLLSVWPSQMARAWALASQGLQGKGPSSLEALLFPPALVHIEFPLVWPLTCPTWVWLSPLQAALGYGTFHFGLRVSARVALGGSMGSGLG